MGNKTRQDMNSQMRVMKTYLKARYRLSDLLRAQRNDRMTSNLKRWIENGAPDKGDLEEDSYRILRQYFMQKEGRLYLNGIVAIRTGLWLKDYIRTGLWLAREEKKTKSYTSITR